MSHPTINYDTTEKSSAPQQRASITSPPPPPIITRRDILWRDFAFFILLGLALRVISYVELHAADSDRGFAAVTTMPTTMLDTVASEGTTNTTKAAGAQIVDTGFVLTAALNDYLAAHPDINDLLAFWNSVILILPTIYATYVTLWLGDYTLSFRLLATQLFRSFCGWFTYLPPDPTFLMSVYDFPEIAQCLFSDCVTKKPEILPFVSFFSGHVATVVIIANHAFMRDYRRSAVILHVLNVFQIMRLLATRGHYSIDIIIGWCVAVSISNPAGKLGASYSRGVTLTELVPKTGMDAFETVTGLSDWKRDDDGLIQTETTARIAAKMAGDLAIQSLAELRKEVEVKGISIQEIHSLRRDDLIRLLSWAHLKIEELKAEARLLEVHLPPEFIDDKKRIIEMMWTRAKNLLNEKGVNWLHSQSGDHDNDFEERKKNQ